MRLKSLSLLVMNWVRMKETWMEIRALLQRSVLMMRDVRECRIQTAEQS